MFVRNLIFFALIIFLPLLAKSQTTLPKRQEMVYAFSLETSGDWLLQKNDIKATGYSWLRNKNSFNPSVSIKCNRYFGTKGWGIYAGLAFGEYKERYYFEVDYGKISSTYYGIVTVPHKDFQTRKDFKRQYLAVSIGASKRWELGKWFVNSDLGFRIHKFTKQPENIRGLYLNYDPDTSGIDFIWVTFGMDFAPEFYPITIEWQNKIGYNLAKNHHLFFNFGFRNFIVPKGYFTHGFGFYNENEQQVGKAEVYTSLRQLNFGLGYQMTF